MKIDDVRRTAYAMPLTNPSFTRGPYRFFNREYLIITYRTDPEALRAVVPEPLEICDSLVNYEFIRMPDSTGFGDYTESGQVIPVRYAGTDGLYVHAMYLDDHAPIAGGRELWGFPKKLAQPKISHERDVITATLHYGQALCAQATIGYKHCVGDAGRALAALRKPNYLIKIIPHVDGTARICELVRYHLEDIQLKECWSAPAELQLFRHVVADVARLPVIEIVSGQHLVADLTLGYGQVVFDYLEEATERDSVLDPVLRRELSHAEW
jgi:acetoacetate decarboxylase